MFVTTTQFLLTTWQCDIAHSLPQLQMLPYTEIRNTFAELTKLLKDMNALTSDVHSQSNFETLLKAIEERLNG